MRTRECARNICRSGNYVKQLPRIETETFLVCITLHRVSHIYVFVHNYMHVFILYVYKYTNGYVCTSWQAINWALWLVVYRYYTPEIVSRVNQTVHIPTSMQSPYSLIYIHTFTLTDDISYRVANKVWQMNQANVRNKQNCHTPCETYLI